MIATNRTRTADTAAVDAAGSDARTPAAAAPAVAAPDAVAPDGGAPGVVGAAATGWPSPAEAARLVARLFPEVYRQFHSGGRLHYGADLPMTRRSLEVLRHLSLSGPLTVGEQAEHLGLRRNSVSELLQRLERRGLVARIRDERDERRVLVWLTEAGQDVVARIGEVLAPDRLEQSLARLSPDDRAIVVRGFELLARAEAPGSPDMTTHLPASRGTSAR